VAEKTIQLAPQARPARSFHAYCQAMLGNTAQAREEFGALVDDLSDTAPGYVAPLVARDHALGERVLARLRQTSGEGSWYQFAEIYAQLERKDEAIQALEKAWIVRDPGLTSMLVDPQLDPLRGDPRFQALFKRLDFPT
jgi:hypothetical protein